MPAALQALPAWQIILVDLRCHGDSSSLTRGKQPHTIAAAAEDVLSLLSRLKLFPQVRCDSFQACRSTVGYV